MGDTSTNMFDKLRPTVRFQVSVENNEVVYSSLVTVMELCNSTTSIMTALVTLVGA